MCIRDRGNAATFAEGRQVNSVCKGDPNGEASYPKARQANNPGTGPQTGELVPIGPQRANRGWPGALRKIPENWEIVQKLGSDEVWGEMGTSKHILETIQSIWVAGFPRISIFEQLPKPNHVFRVRSGSTRTRGGQ